MEEAMAETYWCYQCSQVVTPIVAIEIKCPFCQGGFIEQMSGGTTRGGEDMDSDMGSDRALSLWAPILLGMIGNPRRRRRFDRIDFEEENNNNGNGNGEARNEGRTDLDREFESIIRRRRSSATILQLLQGIRDGMASEVENSENERERVILINPFNRTIIVHGSYDSNQTDLNSNSNHTRSLGNHFMSPGLDLLLQHLAENDSNRYGTPPAQKEAVEALPTVKVEEMSQCAVCLDDLEAGMEAKEMPCKHKFHGECILSWLELHSSCPVCRYQLPADESKLDSERPRANTDRREIGNDVHGIGEGSGNGRRFTIPWPFNGLFSSGSAPQRDENSSGSALQRDET
ncbi:multi-copper oxidase type 1 family protein [Hibiscus syriacus]|uniref:RING-type E3 ubiquitin transferase n=1 Tax=Hibiscus syriacus TaxID=106335 RepID=A0A6A2YL52_HIBSY|nr:E3 ubiquitin-protein ligase SIRP1-like [Hibiscus syriacus]KAE8678824.1 multi-copper oxidase type 1 family protein [Hibiscus syriacus]